MCPNTEKKPAFCTGAAPGTCECGAGCSLVPPGHPVAVHMHARMVDGAVAAIRFWRLPINCWFLFCMTNANGFRRLEEQSIRFAPRTPNRHCGGRAIGWRVASIDDFTPPRPGSFQKRGGIRCLLHCFEWSHDCPE